jgi:hypothetical protein
LRCPQRAIHSAADKGELNRARILSQSDIEVDSTICQKVDSALAPLLRLTDEPGRLSGYTLAPPLAVLVGLDPSYHGW